MVKFLQFAKPQSHKSFPLKYFIVYGRHYTFNQLSLTVFTCKSYLYSKQRGNQDGVSMW